MVLLFISVSLYSYKIGTQDNLVTLEKNNMTKKWSVSRGQDKKLGGKGMGNNSFVRPNPKQGGEYTDY